MNRGDDPYIWQASASGRPSPSVRRTLALRDISDLLIRGVLRKADAGGRSTSYELDDLSK